MLARTKGEAKFLLREYNRVSAEYGLVVKGNSCISPIGTEVRHENKKNNRKRKRSKRKKD